MRTIAVAIQKGGTCKTTTAVNLAAILQRRGKRVLLVDVDPQGNASTYLGVRDDGRKLLEVYAGNAALADCIRETTSGISLVPCGKQFATLDKLLAQEIGAETILRECLAPVAERFDYALLDCPPSLGIMMITSLVAADDVLIPVVAEALPLEGVASFQETLALVRKRLNPKLNQLGIIVSKTENTNLSRDVEQALRKSFGDAVFKTAVRKSTRVAESPSHKQPMTSYAPRDRAAKDFEALTTEVLYRLEAAA